MTNPEQMRELMESVDDWAQPTRYEFHDDQNGDEYLLEFQDQGGEEVGYVEVNGQAAAMFTVGGAGSMGAKIQKPDEVMNMIAALMVDRG